MLLTLVRHGECLGQSDPQFWTDPDSPLSSLGIAQAQAAAQQLAVEIKNINDAAHLRF